LLRRGTYPRDHQTALSNRSPSPRITQGRHSEPTTCRHADGKRDAPVHGAEQPESWLKDIKKNC
jgi:hypothetical protein